MPSCAAEESAPQGRTTTGTERGQLRNKKQNSALPMRGTVRTLIIGFPFVKLPTNRGKIYRVGQQRPLGPIHQATLTAGKVKSSYSIYDSDDTFRALLRSHSGFTRSCR